MTSPFTGHINSPTMGQLIMLTERSGCQSAMTVASCRDSVVTQFTKVSHHGHLHTASLKVGLHTKLPNSLTALFASPCPHMSILYLTFLGTLLTISLPS